MYTCDPTNHYLSIITIASSGTRASRHFFHSTFQIDALSSMELMSQLTYIPFCRSKVSFGALAAGVLVR